MYGFEGILRPPETRVLVAITECARTSAGGCAFAWMLRGWSLELGMELDRRAGRSRWSFRADVYPAGRALSDENWHDLGQIMAAIGIPLSVLGPTQRVPVEWSWEDVSD